MSIGFVFWLLMIIWLVFGFWSWKTTPANWPLLGGSGMLFFLLFLLGWKVFGWPISG